MVRADEQSLVSELLGDAQQISNGLLLRQTALGRLERYLGYDSAIFMVGPELGGTPAVVNKDARLHRQYMGRRDVYQPELIKGAQAARAGGGAYLDTEVYSTAERGRLSFYSEIIRPQGITSQLVAHLYVRSRRLGAVHLCRHGRSGGFRPRDRDRLQALVSALAVAQAACGQLSEGTPLELELSPRERQIAGCLCRGLRTREIAAALGTSPNTVRNQLQRLFEKTGVAGRTELALLLQGQGAAGR